MATNGATVKQLAGVVVTFAVAAGGMVFAGGQRVAQIDQNATKIESLRVAVEQQASLLPSVDRAVMALGIHDERAIKAIEQLTEKLDVVDQGLRRNAETQAAMGATLLSVDKRLERLEAR